MDIFDLIVSAAATLGLAYVGKKKNDEAQARNEACKQAIDNCNKYIDNAKSCVEEREKIVKQYLEWYGNLKLSLFTELYPKFLSALENNFTNFEVIKKYNVEQYSDIKLDCVDEIKQSILYIKRKLNTTNIHEVSDSAHVLSFSLATFGVGAAINGLLGPAIATAIPALGSFTLGAFLPISFGVGYSLAGFFNNYKSKQNLVTAQKYLEETKQLAVKVEEICKYLEDEIKDLEIISDNVSKAGEIFLNECALFLKDINDPTSSLYATSNHPIDAKKLCLKDKKRLRFLYVYSMLYYKLLNVPLHNQNREFLIDARPKTYEICCMIGDELDKYYGS